MKSTHQVFQWLINKSEFLIENPKHKSKSEIEEILKKEARIKWGLTAVSTMYITKPTDKMIPSLRYNQRPKVLTGVQLKDEIKKMKMHNEEKIFQKNSKIHKDVVARIQDKEDAMFNLRVMNDDNPSFKDKLERFRRDNLEQFSQKFGKVTIGVHGKELPKFNDNIKEYWKLKDGYQETNVSRHK